MATVTFQSDPVTTVGELPKVGAQAPDFRLTKTDLSDVSLKDFSGKRKILNIAPSVDTSVCAATAREFEKAIASMSNVVCLTISRDLPFALARFGEAEKIANVTMLSQLRDEAFGRDYGVAITAGPLAGIFSRAVVVLDEGNTVRYSEHVAEITDEPDYQAALKALS